MPKKIMMFGVLLLAPVLGLQAQDFGGPPPFGPKGPGGFGMMNQRRQLVKQFDKDGDGRLNNEERKAARVFLQQGGGGGFGGKGFGKGPKGGPGGFGAPGAFLSKPLLEALDADKDGTVSMAELVVGVKRFFANADKGKKGSLEEAQLRDELNRILPKPQGFPFGGPGGPGGFPGGPGGPGGFPGGPGGPGGFPGGPGGPPQPGQIIPRFLEEPLKLTPKQKKQLEELQKEVEAKLEKILTAEQKKMLKGMGPGGPGGFGPPGGGFGPMGGGFGFGPGNFLARSILQRADGKKSGKVSLDQLVSAAETLFKEADKNKDGKLDEAELGAAISKLFPAPGGFGPPGGGGFGPPGFGPKEPPKPGPKVKPEDVKTYPNAPLYDATVLRTLFLEFENKDWEAELADFYRTDVEVPATLIVDGKKYPHVGVHFRGNSSYFKTSAGYKRSLHLSLDFMNKKQRLYGYKSLTLLNGADDPSLMHTVLFAHVARQHMPALKANFVKLVINGESWGVYPSLQQFNKDFLKENYKTAKGARWKVPGHPGADGGLRYIGDNIADYKRHYQIKSKDNDKDWKALITLCKTVSTTPLDKLEAALEPILDIDGVLWFLAIDNAVINDDGYWVRASDYNIYRDPKGKFHLTAHDTNETFQPMGFAFGGGFGKGPKGSGGFDKGPKGGGFGMGPGGGGYGLDPLIGMNDERKPLRSRLLAVPSLRARYLDHVRTIAENSFDWKNLGPVVEQYRALIEKEVAIDTHKLYSLAEFEAAHAREPAAGRGAHFNLRAFADQRRAFLLNHSEIKKVGVE